MGRMLGAFDESDQTDRPDLNKCPSCGCYFAQDTCPICGTVCPDSMRAGNRAPERRNRRGGSSSGRVTFVDWYHSWWFIILMLIFMPIIGFVLLFTSPHKRVYKVAVTILAVICIGGSFLLSSGLGAELWNLVTNQGELVDTSLSREEYIAACEERNPAQFYRSAEDYSGKFVQMTLTVSTRFAQEEYDYSDDVIYYLCTYGENAEYQILVRDCIRDGAQNFVAGDVITVYGEGAGNLIVHDLDYNSYAAPGIYAAYAELVNE